MAKLKVTGTVLSQDRLAAGIFSMWIRVPEIASQAACGQFISVYCRDRSRLLPRPISLCEIDPAEGSLRIVYRIAGKGTEEFSSYQAGDPIEVLGPLGNGFPTPDEGKSVLLIGGGIGIPPMLQTAKSLRCAKTAVLGYRDQNLFLKEAFEAAADQVLIATEDGSCGTKGNVLDAIREAKVRTDLIYACGPTPMLRALKAYAAEEGIECYLSLEEKMACGIGACLACVCQTKDVDAHSQVHNARICKDGPVFRAEEVEL